MKKILLYFSIKYDGEWAKIYEALNKKEQVNEKLMEEYYIEYKGKYVSIVENNYPDLLKEITRPPFVLFYKGDEKLLSKKIVWPFGTLLEKEYIPSINESISNLEKIHSIITGFSNAFENKVLAESVEPIIVVKDSGIFSKLIIGEEVENQLLKSGGLIISEYPGEVLPTQVNWLDSNRVKVGLSSGLFLINSTKDKELFKTISLSLHENKEVYCLRNPFIDEENHNDTLIEKGAIGVQDIHAEMEGI